MIRHDLVQLALRARALTVSVCTTGNTNLSATATGFARAAGSFVTDGFVAGMEILPSGFSSNTARRVIRSVSALAITTTEECTVQAAAGSRSLAVGFPGVRAWDNETAKQVAHRWYVEEEYDPSPPSRLRTFGAGGQVDHYGLYFLRIGFPSNVGMLAPARLIDELLELFYPSWSTTLSNGDVLRIRGDIGPSRSRTLADGAGWSVIPVTIPWWVQSTNPTS